MFRAPLRRVRVTPGAFGKQRLLPPSTRRGVSSSSPEKRGTWRGTFLRWGLAGGAVYWYNTSPLFADDAPPLTSPAPSPFPEDTKTVDAVIAEKRKEIEARAREREARDAAAAAAAKETEASAEKAGAKGKAPEKEDQEGQGEKLEALEQEAGQQAAFDPETGEINWDCPCLGGMAHGPCGEEFKDAFSCFIHSTEENKGIDCVDKFQAMQDCFRKYPEVYGEELKDDEEASDQAHEEARGSEGAVQTGGPAPTELAGDRAHSSVAADGDPPARPSSSSNAKEAKEAKSDSP